MSTPATTATPIPTPAPTLSTDSLAAAQRDMRHAYFNGAPGLAASALAWFAAGIAALASTPAQAVWTLFIGGMFIHPAGVLIARLAGRPGAHARDNPLAGLALQGTFQLLLCLPIAYVVSLHRMAWFFPAMLFVIGGRYLTFATLYGLSAYLACGALLAAAGYALGASGAPPAAAAFAGALIEAGFAALLFLRGRRAA